MKIEVLGKGCPKCRATENAISKVVKEEGIEAEVIKITDMDEIISRGVMMTPAVFVDGKLVSSGKVPSREDIRKWLNG